MQGILCLSDDQIQDLMFLRRVYFLKRHELNSQCAALRAKMQNQDPHPLANVAMVTSAASQLRQNAAEDRQVLMRFAWAVYFGVWLVTVHAFAA